MITTNIKNVATSHVHFVPDNSVVVKQPAVHFVPDNSVVVKRYNPIQGSGVVKRYFHTQDTEFISPSEFVLSKNKRYIIVQYVGAIVKDTLVGDLMVHSNIVQQDGYCDCFIMLANRRQTKYRKYEFLGHERNYKIWFTDLYGNSIEPSAFVMSCLLVY